MSEGHPCHITYRDRNPIYPLNNDFGCIIRGLVFTHRASNITPLSFIKVASADVPVFNIESLHKFRDSDVSGGHGI